MSDPYLHLIPPHSSDAECAVLAAILTRPYNLDAVSQILIPSDFYQIKHQRILKAMNDLSLDGTEIDLITVTDKLKSAKFLDEVGGSLYLAELLDGFISDAYITDHIKIVKEKSTLRALIVATSLITVECYAEHENIHEFIEKAEKVIIDAANLQGQKTIVSVSEGMAEIFAIMDKIQKSKGALTGVPSGFLDLDKITDGFQKKDLIVLAARPGVGKTSFAINVAEYAAQQRAPVGIFSLEMATSQLLFRLIASKAKVPGDRVRSGRFHEGDNSKIGNAIGNISGLPIYIDDVSGQTMLELRAKARIMKRDHHIELLVIDYLQLMQSGERAENRNLEVGQITRRLKIMAKELDLPIILLSQLNRQVENRGDKRPGLADLRDSGSVEQDSDLVMFLYREFLYAPTPENTHIAELIIGKNRNGPTGTINLVFNQALTQFANGAAKEEKKQEEQPEPRWFDN